MVHWEKKSIKLINSSQTKQGENKKKTWITNIKHCQVQIRADSRNIKQIYKNIYKGNIINNFTPLNVKWTNPLKGTNY